MMRTEHKVDIERIEDPPIRPPVLRMVYPPFMTMSKSQISQKLDIGQEFLFLDEFHFNSVDDLINQDSASKVKTNSALSGGGASEAISFCQLLLFLHISFQSRSFQQV